MARSFTFQNAVIEGYASKVRNGVTQKKILFRALFTNQLALDLDVETPSPDYWGVDLKLELGQAGLVLRPSAIGPLVACLELDVRLLRHFTVKRSDDGPLVVRFEAVLTGSAIALAEHHDSWGEAPGELTITVAEEQTSIDDEPKPVKHVQEVEFDDTKVTMSAPGMAPVKTTMQGIKDATAKLKEKAELKRAQRIRRQAAADGKPFDGGKEERA